MTLPIGLGFGILTQTAGASPVGVQFFENVIGRGIETFWPRAADVLTGQLHAQLDGREVASGFRLYDVGVLLSKDLSCAVERTAGGDLLLTLTTGRCGVVASSTQPTAAGRWADPRVVITFGLSLSFTLHIPSTTQTGLRLSPLQTLRILQPDIDSRSVITDLAFFVDDVIALFRGVRFVEELQDLLARTDFASHVNGAFLDDALAPVNDALAALSEQGYWYLDALVDVLDGSRAAAGGTPLRVPGAPPQTLSLALVARGLDRSGVVEGTVSWPRALGGPQLTVQGLASRIGTGAFSADVLSALRVAEPPFHPLAPVQIPADQAGAYTAMADVGETLVDAPAGEEPLARGIRSLDVSTRGSVLADALAGSVTALGAVLGDARVSREVQEIRRGVDDLVVGAQASRPGVEGGFGMNVPVGTLEALWEDDDETTFRRHYRLTGIPLDAPLLMQVEIGLGWRWSGKALVGVPDGWTSPPVVHRGADERQRPIVAIEAPRAVGAVRAFSGGVEVALNPQPLPPKEVPRIRDLGPLRGRGADRIDVTHASPVLQGSVRKGSILQGSVLRRPGDEVLIDPGRLSQIGRLSKDADASILRGVDLTLVEYKPPIVR